MLALTRVEGVTFELKFENDVVGGKDGLAVFIDLVPGRLRGSVNSAPTRPFSSPIHSLRGWLVFTEITAGLAVTTKEEHLRTFIIDTGFPRLRIWEVLNVVTQQILLIARQDPREAIQTEEITRR
jgi:hypothetical protein